MITVLVEGMSCANGIAKNLHYRGITTQTAEDVRMNIEKIKEKLKLVLDDISKASKAESPVEAFRICQNLEYSVILLSDMLDELEPSVGSFTKADFRIVLERVSDITLTDQDLDTVFQFAEDNFSAETGMSWDVIEHFYETCNHNKTINGKG